MAQLVAHLVRDQEVAGSSPVIQTILNQALTEMWVLFFFLLVAVLSQFQCVLTHFLFYASFVTLIVSSLIAAIPIIRPSQPGSSVPDNTGAIIDSLCLKTDYEKRIDSVSINVPKDSSLFKIAVSDSNFINQNQQ